jgi:uncharacterized protein
MNPDVTARAPGWGIRDILLGILLYLLCIAALGALTLAPRLLRLELSADVRLPLQSLALLVFEGLLVMPVWMVVFLRRKAGWAEVGFRHFAPLVGCSLPLAYLFVAFAASAIWGVVIQAMHWPTQQSLEPIFGSNPVSIAIGFVAACIVAPLAEETFFRGFVIGGLRRRFGTIGALLISALFFSLLHPPFTILPIIFLLGSLLGLLYLQTGSLWPGILMHAAFNTLGFIAQFAINR